MGREARRCRPGRCWTAGATGWTPCCGSRCRRQASATSGSARSAWTGATCTRGSRAARSYRTLDEQAFYADNRRTLEPAYLRGTTPRQASGFGGDEREWEQARRHITEGIAGHGTFLDVGCANGLLMESVAAWCAERGLAVEPYGVDISPALAELARRRLPRWAGRIWTGNAVDWQPPGA